MPTSAGHTQGTTMAWCNTFCSFGIYVDNLSVFLIYQQKQYMYFHGDQVQ